MLRTFAFSVVALFLFSMSPASADDKLEKKAEEANQADREKLNGVWAVAKMEIGGQELPKEFFSTIVLTIDSGKYTVEGIPEGKQSGISTIDASKEVKEMTIEAKEGPQSGTTTKAIYKFDEEKLVVCYNIGQADFPREFKTAEGEPYLLITYERKKDAEKK